MPATVTAVHELPLIGGGDGLENSAYRRRRYWSVVLSEPAATGGELALAASGIPAIGAAHPSLSGLYATSRGFDTDSEITDGSVWTVFVDYTIPSASGTTVAPWDREDRISFADARYEVGATKDKAGDYYKNSVGESLEVTETRINPVLIVRRYRKRVSFDPFAVYPLVDTLNSGSITVRGTTIAAEKALLLRFSVEDERWGDGTLLYAIRYEIELEAGMVLKTQRYQNKSYYHFVAGVRYRATDVAKNPDTGGALERNGKKVVVPTASPVFIDLSGARVEAPESTDVSTYDIVRVKHASASWTPLN
jgi:hypothetical protein